MIVRNYIIDFTYVIVERFLDFIIFLQAKDSLKFYINKMAI